MERRLTAILAADVVGHGQAFWRDCRRDGIQRSVYV
jgi:hypothetical protein